MVVLVDRSFSLSQALSQVHLLMMQLPRTQSYLLLGSGTVRDLDIMYSSIWQAKSFFQVVMIFAMEATLLLILFLVTGFVTDPFVDDATSQNTVIPTAGVWHSSRSECYVFFHLASQVIMIFGKSRLLEVKIQEGIRQVPCYSVLQVRYCLCFSHPDTVLEFQPLVVHLEQVRQKMSLI
jgi:hypothetical protein